MVHLVSEKDAQSARPCQCSNGELELGRRRGNEIATSGRCAPSTNLGQDRQAAVGTFLPFPNDWSHGRYCQ